MSKLPENLRQRILFARPTPARLSAIYTGLEQAINERNLDDAFVDLDFVFEGEEFGENDLLPSMTFRLRRAVPPPKLILPELELPKGP